MTQPMGFKIIPNAFDQFDEAIEWMKEQTWLRSETTTGVHDIRTSDTLGIPLLAFTNPSCIHRMNQAVYEAMDAYAKEWDFSFTGIENVSVQRYRAADAQHYGVHTDAGPGVPRVLSAVLYLNTVEEGGETYFPHFDLAVQPIAGTVVLFPSNFLYAHEARPPKKGIKYAAAYWAHQ